MEIKSVSECLNFIDDMILCSVEKNVGVGISEDLRDFMIDMYNEKYIEELVTMLAILSQIDFIIKKIYLDNESDIKKQYCCWRKRILTWLEVSKRKAEINDQQ